MLRILPIPFPGQPCGEGRAPPCRVGDQPAMLHLQPARVSFWNSWQTSSYSEVNLCRTPGRCTLAERDPHVHLLLAMTCSAMMHLWQFWAPKGEDGQRPGPSIPAPRTLRLDRAVVVRLRVLGRQGRQDAGRNPRSALIFAARARTNSWRSLSMRSRYTSRLSTLVDVPRNSSAPWPIARPECALSLCERVPCFTTLPL